LADHENIASLNLTRGCVHRCGFCSVRAYPSYPGDEVIYLYTDTVERLADELNHSRKRPDHVYVSPSTDPFPPLAGIQAETERVVVTLAELGVEAWLMTRGFIRPQTLRTLATHRDYVRITVGLTTLDRKLQRRLEPLAAPPRLRIRQVSQLRELGISVQVALEPLIPGLTDTRANLTPLLAALAKAGVRHISAGYLFLRAGIRENLLRLLEPFGLAGKVFEAFAAGPVLPSGPIAPARYLPKARRQRGYAALMALAAEFGITVSVSRPTNPDFVLPRREDTSARSLRPLFARFGERQHKMLRA
jgi:DNA repair photolyase